MEVRGIQREEGERMDTRGLEREEGERMRIRGLERQIKVSSLERGRDWRLWA